MSSILTGVFFSVFADLDHIPHLPKAFRTGRFGVEARSPLHEIPGLALILIGSMFADVVFSHPFHLTFGCGLSHFVVDLLTRPCRPLYPFSAREVDLKLYPRGLREMFIWDAIFTVGLGLIYVVITII